MWRRRRRDKPLELELVANPDNAGLDSAGVMGLALRRLFECPTGTAVRLAISDLRPCPDAGGGAKLGPAAPTRSAPARFA